MNALEREVRGLRRAPRQTAADSRSTPDVESPLAIEARISQLMRTLLRADSLEESSAQRAQVEIGRMAGRLGPCVVATEIQGFLHRTPLVDKAGAVYRKSREYMIAARLYQRHILAQIAAIVLLLKRTFSFIIRITNQLRKLYQSQDPTLKEKLIPPFIPKSIRNIIQLE